MQRLSDCFLPIASGQPFGPCWRSQSMQPAAQSMQPVAQRLMQQDDEVELKPLHFWCDDSQSGTHQTMPCTEESFWIPKISHVSGPCWRSQLGDIRDLVLWRGDQPAAPRFPRRQASPG